MGVYEAVKDAAKIAQKADNIELYTKLLDVQQMALDMQGNQQKLQQQITLLKEENSLLKKKKEYVYPESHTWLINPERPDLTLCPQCLNRDGFENPMSKNGSSRYCSTCNKMFH